MPDATQLSMIEGMDAPMGSERPGPRCRWCGAPLRRYTVTAPDRNRVIWRVPVSLCNTPECLARLGGRVTRTVPVGGLHEWR